jgi:zinc D-Ala-D-Ala dipeptidase
MKYIFVLLSMITMVVALAIPSCLNSNMYSMPRKEPTPVTSVRSKSPVAHFTPTSPLNSNKLLTSTPITSRSKNDLVDVNTVAPKILLDIRYATPNNFMKQTVYPVARCLLHTKVAKQLQEVQTELEKEQIGLKVFDCYRPLSIQKKMWKILPDSNYVANPAKGSRHNRASAVDITLVDLASGQEKEMPTEFDEFSKRANIDYKDASPSAKKNRKRLRAAMEKHGFKNMNTEWWHYDSIGWEKYPLLDVPLNAPDTKSKLEDEMGDNQEEDQAPATPAP